jgi:cysteinyl-tRNA synthetase
VNTWLHAGFLQMEQEKMSKSLGNFLTLRELLEKNAAESVRYFLMASHYRSSLTYSADLVQQAKQALTRFYTALRFLPNREPVANSTYEKEFILAMDDDFNTPVALSVLFDLAHEIQRLRMHNEALAAQHAALLKQLGSVLGILQQNPDLYFQTGSVIDHIEIETLIAARQKARQDKNWAEADRIRQVLAKQDILIEDTARGTTWKRG